MTSAPAPATSTQSRPTMTATTQQPQQPQQHGRAQNKPADGVFFKALRWINRSPQQQHRQQRDFAPIPHTSQDRLDASLDDTPLDAHKLTASDLSAAHEKGKTVLYLAYGSNLCKETFRGMRGIQPVSQVNVVVPSLRLTFDLAGVPYKEPCFANSARRDPNAPIAPSDYHKDRWHKGMVGVVYEVTLRDYAHIIATEGGGSSYQDILVDCHVLADTDTVPMTPTSRPFKAHTLFAPAIQDDNTRTTGRISRPDPSYAQPSARYIKLITDGAAECALPAEYQSYLSAIRPYTITNRRQAIGAAIYAALWFPVILAVFALARKMQDKHGRAPAWVAKLTSMAFAGMWLHYDYVFKGAFGDGERTMKRETDDEAKARRERVYSGEEMENEGLLEEAVESLNVAPAKEGSGTEACV
jgi:hypothetical protein